MFLPQRGDGRNFLIKERGMYIPKLISKIVALILLGIFWFFAGLMLAPFWFLVVITGILLGAFEIEESPKIFWDLVTIKWFL